MGWSWEVKQCFKCTKEVCLLLFLIYRISWVQGTSGSGIFSLVSDTMSTVFVGWCLEQNNWVFKCYKCNLSRKQSNFTTEQTTVYVEVGKITGLLNLNLFPSVCNLFISKLILQIYWVQILPKVCIQSGYRSTHLLISRLKWTSLFFL